jgi:Uma2 family endonuclease
MVAKRAERRTAAKPAARLERRRFSVDEYDRLIEAGILQEDEHVELLGGEIVCMAPIGIPHANVVSFLLNWFARRLPEAFHVRVQDPIRVPPNAEPEPDLVIVRGPIGTYFRAHPGPADVLLVIEVADTSLAHDRDVKGPLYAAAGIPDYWLLDLTGEQILVQREPKRGRYTRVEAVRRGGTLAPLAFPDLVLPLDELLGPAPQA